MPEYMIGYVVLAIGFAVLYVAAIATTYTCNRGDW